MPAAVLYSVSLEIMLDNALQPFCEREFPELMKENP